MTPNNIGCAPFCGPGGDGKVDMVAGLSIKGGGELTVSSEWFATSDLDMTLSNPPNIEIVKEVSVDGGVTFFDANDSASAPATAVGGGALYRLTVTNTGAERPRRTWSSTTPTLGIVDFLVGDLAAGQTVVLTSGEIPQLEQPGRCQDPGDVTNIATVDGESVDTGNP